MARHPAALPDEDHAVSDWRICAAGMRAPIRAGMLAITATDTKMASTTAASHQTGGIVSTPPLFAARNSPRPSGMPSSAPGTAGSTCAHATPALT